MSNSFTSTVTTDPMDYEAAYRYDKEQQMGAKKHRKAIDDLIYGLEMYCSGSINQEAFDAIMGELHRKAATAERDRVAHKDSAKYYAKMMKEDAAKKRGNADG